LRQILHISDIHFGPHFLTEVADAVRDLVERRRPDLVVISGDLTQRARIEQFQDARAWVDSLPVPCLAVPGNHDVPMYRVWERVLSPFGVYQRYFDEEMEPIFEDEELYVIGINTAFNWTVKDGQVTSESLRRMARILKEAPTDKARIVVAHHHLIPPPRFDTQRVTRHAREAVELFSREKVEMVLSGHLHQTYIATSEEYYPRGERPVLLVHSGTTTSGRGRGWEKKRNSCNWISLDDQTVTIHHLLWQPEARAFQEWSRHSYPRHSRESFSLLGCFDDAIS
jgi:3',5'-cyclic AMP phosphodiesterase CpdA